MLAADAYQPDHWHDFFLTVGGAAAVLAGLVFVALSLNLSMVMRDITHRSRAVGTLTNFVGIFAVCALALLGMPAQTLIAPATAATKRILRGVIRFPWGVLVLSWRRPPSATIAARSCAACLMWHLD